MHLSIEISPQAEAKIVAASMTTGKDIATLIENLIEHMPSPETQVLPVDQKKAEAIALLRSWRAEDATDDEEELARRDVANEELMRNLQANPVWLRTPKTQ